MEAIAKGRGTLSMTDLALRTGLPRSSVHRLLMALEEEQYIMSAPDKSGYALGPALQPVGLSAYLRLLTTHHAHLITVSRSVGENVELGVLSDGDAVVIDRVNASDRFAGATGIGTHIPLHATSLGKAVLAQVPDNKLDLRHPLRRFTSHTVTDRRTLLSQLETIRRLHIAIDVDEHRTGACGVATATNTAGTIRAIAVVMPTSRLRRKIGLAIEALHHCNPLIDITAAKRQYCR